MQAGTCCNNRWGGGCELGPAGRVCVHCGGSILLCTAGVDMGQVGGRERARR
jgi:hypothetical protein